MKIIRRTKGSIAFLIEERDQVRKTLSELKTLQTKLIRNTNSRSPSFLAAFVTATEIILNDDQFLEIEHKAMSILKDTKNNRIMANGVK